MQIEESTPSSRAARLASAPPPPAGCEPPAATVTIADLNAEQGEALAAELAAGASCRATSPTPAQVAGRRRRRAAGGCGSPSTAPASAGPSAPPASTGRTTSTPFEKVIQINLIGTFNVLRLAAAAMTPTSPTPSGERGVCINTASIAAFDGQIGQLAYRGVQGRRSSA